MSKIEDELKKILDKAMENGEEVIVHKIRKEDISPDLFKKLEKLAEEKGTTVEISEETLEDYADEDDRIKHIIEKLRNRTSNKSDREIFESCNRSYMKLVTSTGRHPEVGLAFLVTKKGECVMTSCNISGAKKLSQLLRALADMVDEGRIIED